LQVNTIAAEIGSTGQKLMAIALLALGFAKRELPGEGDTGFSGIGSRYAG
jgi:hypothetical protein